MKINNIEKHTDLELINLIITLISDYKMFITNWGEFLFGKELDLPTEHKNKIFTIWFCGTIDTIIDYEHQYQPLLEQTKLRKLKNCESLLQEFEEFVQSIIKNVNTIDVDSQILLNHFRNTLVHGRVLSIHNKKSINLRFLNPKTNLIEKFKGNTDDFWKINRDVITNSMDNFIDPLRVQYFDKSTDYYQNICIMSDKDFLKRLTDIAYQDK